MLRMDQWHQWAASVLDRARFNESIQFALDLGLHADSHGGADDPVDVLGTTRPVGGGGAVSGNEDDGVLTAKLLCRDGMF